MWRSFFLLGALTGFVCALAFTLEPLPDRGNISRDTLVSIPEATYRMDGLITRNTCPSRPAPWPYLWTVAGEELHIGDESIRARFLRAATLYEAVRVSPNGCVLATWSIKLIPLGAGVRGSASWEVRAHDAAGKHCRVADSERDGAAPSGLPCVVEADIFGLPEEVISTQNHSVDPDPE